jgi:TatD DNase family protein
VAEREAEIALWETYLPEARYVGEVGLDASPRYYGSFDRQRKVFARVLQVCAESGDKVLTVHSLRAATQVLAMIEAHLPPERGRVVLHWFTGSGSEARRAVELGCYFSVNAEMGHTPHGRALLRKLPLDRLLTETDGPFTRIEGRAARPADAQAALEALAQARGTGVEIIAAAVWANLSALLHTVGGDSAKLPI